MENLRIIREKQGKSQVNVAVNIGVAQEMISSYESGKSLPSANTLVKLAKYLNTSTDYLLGLTDDATPIRLFDKHNLSPKEIEFLLKFDHLAAEDQLKLIGYMDALAEANNKIRITI